MIVSIKNRIEGLRSDRSGMTIIELLVVLPIATLMVAFLAGILFSQYGSVLAEAKRSSLRANAQAIMTGIQDEFLFSISYSSSLDTLLDDSNVPNEAQYFNGTSYEWTNATTPDTLIIYEAVIDSPRRDENRNLVRRTVSPCTSSAINANPFAINNVIYFIEEDPLSNYDVLKKRSITPTYALCSIDRNTGNPCVPETATCLDNFRATTCPESQVSIDVNCERPDIVLSEDIIDFDIRYFQENNVETSFPDAADQIEMTMVLGDKVFGRDVEVEVKHRIRKIN